MNIKCLNTLDKELQDKLKLAKRECINLPDISYTGVEQKTKDEKGETTIYSLLPTLENIQFLKRKTDTKKEVYMIKADLVADISEEALNTLLKEIGTTYSELSNTGFYRGISLPEEIEANFRILESLSKGRERGKLNSIFTDYTNLIAKIRTMQTNSLEEVQRL